MSEIKKDPIFIAEIKLKNPFDDPCLSTGYSFTELMEVAIEHGDWISVHTNALWGGDMDTISYVRNCTDKPILAKGIHGTDDDVQRALDHGATHVLVVNRIPDDKLVSKCLLEVDNKTFNANSLRWAAKWVYNSRNLRTGKPKIDDLDHFIKNAASKWVCQASGIRKPEDVKPGVSAFIVGSYLPTFAYAWTDRRKIKAT